MLILIFFSIEHNSKARNGDAGVTSARQLLPFLDQLWTIWEQNEQDMSCFAILLKSDFTMGVLL